MANARLFSTAAFTTRRGGGGGGARDAVKNLDARHPHRDIFRGGYRRLRSSVPIAAGSVLCGGSLLVAPAPVVPTRSDVRPTRPVVVARQPSAVRRSVPPTARRNCCPPHFRASASSVGGASRVVGAPIGGTATIGVAIAAGFGTGTAVACERRRQKHSAAAGRGNEGDAAGESAGKEAGDGDGFFDLAQQWANEKLKPSIQGGISSESNAGASGDGAKGGSAATDAGGVRASRKSGGGGAEAFLARIGVLGGSIGGAAVDSNQLGTGFGIRPSISQNRLWGCNEGTSNGGREEGDGNGFEDRAREMMRRAFVKIEEEVKVFQRKRGGGEDDGDGGIDRDEIASDSDSSGLDDAFGTGQDRDSSPTKDVLSFAKTVFSVLSSPSPLSSESNIHELINRSIQLANNNSNSAKGTATQSPEGYLDQFLYVQQNLGVVKKEIQKSFEHLNFDEIWSGWDNASMYYYLEREDEMKNPSWKRRRHRFCSSVRVKEVRELNEALKLSDLSYADTVEEVKEGLVLLGRSEKRGGESEISSSGEVDGSGKPQWELIYCDTQSLPNRPSHYLAVQKNASKWDNTLNVIMVVRGTKSISDLVTDAGLEAVDYDYDVRDDGSEFVVGGRSNGKDGAVEATRGKAHGGMIKSGQYLMEQHEPMLLNLRKLAQKRKINLTIIGHSLGAGSATIAAMEWKKRHGSDGVEVMVIGFGCPALLSRELSERTKNFVTTVVADADVVPRTSAATLANLVLDVRDFDYSSRAERDVEHALGELRRGAPRFVSDADVKAVAGYVRDALGKTQAAKQPEGTATKATERMDPVLFPPGTCIHFYRDGSGISGSYVPCTFFDEIDITRTMVDDHLISSGYGKIFLNMMRDFHKDDHFTFEVKGNNHSWK